MNKLRLRPPFSHSKWLFAFLFATWSAAFAMLDACGKANGYLILSIATATICVLLWANHIRVLQAPLPLKLYEIVAGTLYDFGSLFLASAVVWIAITMYRGSVDCYTDRARVSEAVIIGSSVKEQVEANARARGSLEGSGLGVDFKPSGRYVNGGYVSRNGTIVVTARDPVAIVVFQPRLDNGRVVWDCAGYPSPVLPAACRQLPAFP